jgi:hypothetical protein
LPDAQRAIGAIQPPASDLVTLRSYSGQFIAYAARSAKLLPAVSSLATNQDFVRLEPTLATVSCERIKQLLLRELNVTGPWRGTIYLALYPAAAAGDPITIASQRFKNGWQYQVDLPNVVERARYVRAILQVLLLELANRAALGRGAEVPFWLVEGFSQLLLASNEVEIILSPPTVGPNGYHVAASFVASRKQTLLQQAEKQLAGRPPMTFEALSWPSDQDSADEAGGRTYRGSAQLFVGELLRLPDGRACLRRMLERLPQHYNWQFAFLDAFHTHFERPLDVEKWWALAIAQANGHSTGQAWSVAESWQKLDQAVHAAVQVRTSTNQLPLHTEVNLQQMIRQSDPVRQTQALNNTLRELALLRWRIAQEYVGLVQDYCQVIEMYLQQRDRTSSSFPFTRQAGRKRATDAVVQQLDALDARRIAMRPGPKPAPESPSPAPPAQAP